MHFALIAAGEGSRLQNEGILTPKPLVRIQGRELMGRLMDLFQRMGAERVSVIINAHMPQVKAYLDSLRLSCPLDVVVKTTPDSFHSLLALYPLLRDTQRCCLLTVDPVFREDEFRAFTGRFQNLTDDALMGVTDYIDDEKPLYVDVDPADWRVRGYHSEPGGEGLRYISAGMYCLGAKALEMIPQAELRGVRRMRGFQQFLVESGCTVRAFPFSKVIDIDHREDIAKAEALLLAASAKNP